MKKRVLSIVLTLALVLSLCPIYATANVEETETEANEEVTDINSVLENYTPYRTPEEILMTNYGYSLETAREILRGNYESETILYVYDFSDLETALFQPVYKIAVILVDEIVFEYNLEVDFIYPKCVIADHPVTFKTKGYFNQNGNFFFHNIANSQYVGKDYLRFSNIIFDCSSRVCGFSSDRELRESYEGRPLVVEGAYFYSSGTTTFNASVVSAKGDIHLVGCTFSYNNSTKIDEFNGLNLDIQNKAVIKDCTFEGLVNAIKLQSTRTPYSESIEYPNLVIENCIIKNCENGITCKPSSDGKVHYNAVIRDCHIEEFQNSGISISQAVNLTLENTEITQEMKRRDTVGIDFDSQNIIIKNVSVSNVGHGCKAGTNLNGAINIMDSEFDSVDYGVYLTKPYGTSTLDHLSFLNAGTGVYQYVTGDSSTRTSTVMVKNSNFNNSTKAIHTNIGENLYVNSTEIMNSSEAGILVEGGKVSIEDSKIACVNETPCGPGISVQKNAEITVVNTEISGITASQGSGIFVKNNVDLSKPITIQNCKFLRNTASEDGGAIYVGNYEKLLIDEKTVFSGNTAKAAYIPPISASKMYPEIKSASASIYYHPLNNFDINYTVKAIIPPKEFQGITVEHGTTPAQVQALLETNYSQVNVKISDGSSLNLPITWDVAGSAYNGNVHNLYTIYGTFSNSDESIKNPENWQPKVDITVSPLPEKVIIGVDSQEITVPQNIFLKPINKTPSFGTPHTITPPETATVHCQGGETTTLPVHWHVEDFHPEIVGEQTICGDVLTEGTEYSNESGIPAKLIINVTAAEYLIWAAEPLEISVVTYQNTMLEELYDQMVSDGSAEIAVNGMDMDSEFERITFCNILLKPEDNPQWNEQMLVPGEYNLKASLPSNFTSLDEETPGEISVHVTVREPSPISRVDTVYVDEYQSIDPENFDNIPSQVSVTLLDNSKVDIDVEWDFASYNKDVAGNQTLIGKLINLPKMAKQPDDGEIKASMVVRVQRVDYEILSVLSGDQYTVKSGLTLAEITEMVHPRLTYEISSVTDGTDFVLEYEVPVILDDEVNAENFNSKEAGGYVVNGTVKLPPNIYTNLYPAYEEILLETETAKILRLETPRIMVREGTPFADIQNKPETVTAVLDVIGPDGKNKREELPVDWGTGDGYDPNPAGLTDDNCVEMTVEGQIVSKPQYIAYSALKPVLFIGVCREFEIKSITPSRIPETGAVPVDLGSSLEDIFNQLEQQTVTLTLESTNGVTSTQEVTFELRAQENPNYNPEATTTDTYTLTGYLPVADNIKNPSGLKVEVVVETKRHSITNTKIGRVTGVTSGTAFEHVPMPATSEVVRDDGKVEAVPVQWDGSKYDPEKLGTQIISGTFTLPRHLENPGNRQPKVFVTVVDSTATILSMEQILDEPQVMMLYNLEEDEISDYTEYKFRLELLHKDGSVTEEIISMYSEK